MIRNAIIAFVALFACYVAAPANPDKPAVTGGVLSFRDHSAMSSLR
jgi:hypothetical protein